MSSTHQFLQSPNSASSTSRLGDIEHITQLSENISSLFMNQEYSDVVLVVEGHRLHAHKVILAARSEYFKALLYGGMKESKQTEIELPDAPLKAFKTLLKYIYSGHIFLMTLREDIILDTLGLAHQYGFQELETAISHILRQLLALKNVCAILDTARLYGLEQLVAVCHSFFDQNASDILQHETFTQLSHDCLIELLERDSFFAPEVEIFKGVCDWCKANGDRDEVIRCVRLPLMSVTDLLSVVRPAALVKPDTLLDAIAERTNAKLSSLAHRGQLIIDENVASQRMGSKVIAGELMEALLDGDHFNYDMERGYTRHAIDTGNNQCIIVKLGKPSIVNHFKMLLWDRDLRSYSYYVEVSIELKDWLRVVDYSNHSCRSWQSLYFKTRVVQYIRIVGTHNTVNKVFHLVAFEAMYKEKMPALIDDIIAPTYNVATLEKSACVIEGVSRSRNALLNGDTKNYNLETGYTCHQLGSGAITIQLGQPYIISSLRLLLWDCDDRSYRYYIESSVNIWDWEMVVDKTRENCRSWQIVHFPPRPVVYIRIVGTQNTANEVFHCVHFECPSKYNDNEQNDDDNNNTTTSTTTLRHSRNSNRNDDLVAVRLASPQPAAPSASQQQQQQQQEQQQVDSAQQPTETATEAEELQYAVDDAND